MASSGLSAATFMAHATYTLPQSRSPRGALFRSRAFAQAALTVSDTTHPPSGPWLRQRLFCPPASSLTTATSESLAFRIGLWLIPDAFSNARGSPIYSASLSGSCRFPYPGGFHGCTGLLLHRGCCLRRLCIGSATASSDRPVWSEQRNEAAEFASMLRPDPIACPAPARAFTPFSPVDAATRQRRL